MSKNRKGFVLWFTGLPCSGKTTLARAVRKKLLQAGYPNVQHLDGDLVRRNLCADLGFSRRDREQNATRVAFVASLLAHNGVPTLVSLISPHRAARKKARQCVRPFPFIEIYLKCPAKVCEKRDVRGMYRLARQGKIKNFTGVSDSYEEPLQPEIWLSTDRQSVKACVADIMDYLKRTIR